MCTVLREWSLEEQLKEAKELHKKEMDALEERLRSENKLVIQTLREEMDRTRKDLEQKLAQAEAQRGSRKRRCAIM